MNKQLLYFIANQLNHCRDEINRERVRYGMLPVHKKLERFTLIDDLLSDLVYKLRETIEEE